MLLAAMATTCDHNTARSLVAAGGGGGAGSFRLRPVFSTAAFRRQLLEAVMCGGGGGGDRGGKKGRNSRTLPLDPAPERRGSERLSQKAEAEDAETRRKIETYEELQLVVKRLQTCCCDDRRKEAAINVRRLAKCDAGARETLAMLGAIPPLVEMLDATGNVDLNVTTLYALLNLGIGNDMNKAAIVKAGLVHEMLVLIESGNSPPATLEAIVANLLGLSALDSNKTIIGSSGAITFLVKSFTNHTSSSQERQDALRALLNLSISPPNIPCLIESGIVATVFAALGDMEGRLAMSRAPDAIAALADVLSWSDAPGCQEKAAYVLMVVAYKAGGRERAAMVEGGVVSALLELTLLGSSLSQRRASRLLEILTVEKGKQVSEGFGDGRMRTVSAPAAEGGEEEGDDGSGMSEERRAVKQLVQQSNMRRIAWRANLPQDLAPSDHFKALTASSTSKSLPF